MIKKILLFIGIVFSLAFYACEDDTEESNETKSCSVRSENHFAGDINGIQKQFIDGEDNYQRYSGGEILGSEAPKGRFVIGINTWPISVGDESVFMHTPKIDTKDFNDVVAKLPVGQLSLAQRKDFSFRYEVLQKIEGHIATILEGRFDENSSIEICNVALIPMSGPTIMYRVGLEFSCDLYSLDGEFMGELKDASITGIIHVDND